MEKDAQYKELLRSHGIRATRAMVDVLRTLIEIKKPLSIEDVIKKITPKIDTSTTYRILERFHEKNIVRVVDLGHGHTHYEINRHDDHHHLVCNICGMIEDISGCEIEAFSKKIIRTSHSFIDITHHSLELFGTCKTCAYKR